MIEGSYTEDLAFIHDVGFGDFSKRAAPELLKILRRHGILRGMVTDLGCGSGLWARALDTAGYGVLGVDLSAAMIRMARERVHEGRFVQGSFLDAELPRSVAVTALGESLSYLSDPGNSRRQLDRLFERIFRALLPEGLLIFDVLEPSSAAGRSTAAQWEGPDWAVLLRVEENPEDLTLVRRITTFRKVGACYRRRRETHRLLLFRSTEVARSLRSRGFRVRIVRGYGDCKFPACRVGFVARKPASALSLVPLPEEAPRAGQASHRGVAKTTPA